MILFSSSFSVLWRRLHQPRAGSTQGSNGWFFPVVSGRDVLKYDPGILLQEGAEGAVASGL